MLLPDGDPILLPREPPEQPLLWVSIKTCRENKRTSEGKQVSPYGGLTLQRGSARLPAWGCGVKNQSWRERTLCGTFRG